MHCGAVHPSFYRYRSHVVGAVEIRRVSEPGMAPRGATKLLLMGKVHLPRAALALRAPTNKRKPIGVSTQCGAVSTMGISVFAPVLSEL